MSSAGSTQQPSYHVHAQHTLQPSKLGTLDEERTSNIASSPQAVQEDSIAEESGWVQGQVVENRRLSGGGDAEVDKREMPVENVVPSEGLPESRADDAGEVDTGPSPSNGPIWKSSHSPPPAKSVVPTSPPSNASRITESDELQSTSDGHHSSSQNHTEDHGPYVPTPPEPPSQPPIKLAQPPPPAPVPTAKIKANTPQKQKPISTYSPKILPLSRSTLSFRHSSAASPSRQMRPFERTKSGSRTMKKPSPEQESFGGEILHMRPIERFGKIFAVNSVEQRRENTDEEDEDEHTEEGSEAGVLEETEKDEDVVSDHEHSEALEEPERNGLEADGEHKAGSGETEKGLVRDIQDQNGRASIHAEQKGKMNAPVGDEDEDDEEDGIDWEKPVSYQRPLEKLDSMPSKIDGDVVSNPADVPEVKVASTTEGANSNGNHKMPTAPSTPLTKPAKSLGPTFSNQADFIPLPTTSTSTSPIARRRFADMAPSETTGSEANASQNIFGTQASESIGEEPEQPVAADFQATQMRRRSPSPEDEGSGDESEGGKGLPSPKRALMPVKDNENEIHFDDPPESSVNDPAPIVNGNRPITALEFPAPLPNTMLQAFGVHDTPQEPVTPLVAQFSPVTNSGERGAVESTSVPSVSKARMLVRRNKDGGSDTIVKPGTPVVRPRQLGLGRPGPAIRHTRPAQPVLEDTQPATQLVETAVINDTMPRSNRTAELEATYSTQSAPAIIPPVLPHGLEAKYSTQRAVDPIPITADHPPSSPPQIPDVTMSSPRAPNLPSSPPPVPAKPARRVPAPIEPTYRSVSPDPIALESIAASPTHLAPAHTDALPSTKAIDSSSLNQNEVTSLPTRPKPPAVSRRYGAKGKGKVLAALVSSDQSDVDMDAGDEASQRADAVDRDGDVEMEHGGQVDNNEEEADAIEKDGEEDGNTSSSSEPVDPYDGSYRLPKPSNHASKLNSSSKTKCKHTPKPRDLRKKLPPIEAEDSEPEDAPRPAPRNKGKRKRISSASSTPGEGDSSSSAPPDPEDYTYKDTKGKIDRPVAKKSRTSAVSVVVNSRKGKGSTTSHRSTPIPGGSTKVGMLTNKDKGKEKVVTSPPVNQPDGNPATEMNNDSDTDIRNDNTRPSLPDGPRVLAAWDKQTGYWTGTVIGLQNTSYMVYFDDGTIKPVKFDEMRICRFQRGDIVKEDETDHKKIDFVVVEDLEEGADGLIVKAQGEDAKILALDRVYVKLGIIRSHFKGRFVTEDYLASVPPYKPTKVAAIQQADSRPPSRVISERSRLSTNSNKQVLSDKIFLITSVHSKSSAEYRKLTEQVRALGGAVEEDWTRLFVIPKDGFGSVLKVKTGIAPFLIVDGDSGGMKPKFMAALAVGMPCLSSHFLIDAEKNDNVDWRAYLISSGYSKVLGSHCSQLVDPNWGNANWVSRSAKNPRRPFEGMSILFLDAADRDVYADVRQLVPFCMSALGATKFEWTAMITKGSRLEDYDYVLVEDRDEKFGKVAKEIRDKSKFGNTAWLKQCLIMGVALPPELMKN